MRNVMRGGVMRGGVMLGGVMRSQRGGFDPLTLFSAGQQGAWYDPSDLSTLWQDAAGTIPVTANGDPVGRVGDKSGNANHGTQSTTANKPTYRAGPDALEGDGDDSLTMPGPFYFAAGSATFVVAVKGPSGSTQRLFAEGSSVSSTPLYMIAKSSSGGKIRLFQRNDSNSASELISATTVFDDTWHIVTVKDTGNSVVFRIDGVEEPAQSYSRSGTTTLNAQLLFASPSSPIPYDGEMAGFIGRVGVLSDSEIQGVEQFLADKVGLTL